MTLEGSDVSHFQDVLTTWKAGHYAFMGIKMSEGTYQTDPNFAANRAILRSVAMPRWIYHEVTAHEAPETQAERIMHASGGFLYPRERIALALGDFGANAATCDLLRKIILETGPAKRARGKKPWRTVPVLYANRSNFETVYAKIPGPRIVAAFPGPPAPVDCVMHQNANHDPITGGDHDIWIGGQNTGPNLSDLQKFFLS
jgi:hypothetical protein